MYMTRRYCGQSAWLEKPDSNLIEGLTIVSSHKGVPIRPPLLAVDVLLGLLESDVHVAIDRLQFTCVGVLSLCSQE